MVVDLLSFREHEGDLLILLMQKRHDEMCQIKVEFGGQRVVTAQFWEFPIDCPDDLDIVMFDEV